MKNRGVTGRDRSMNITWTYPPITPSEDMKRKMLARMVEIGVRTLFTHFCYSFGGENYLQMSGGPIGARVTMAAARIVMVARLLIV